MFIPDRAKYFRATRKSGHPETIIEFFPEQPKLLHTVKVDTIDSGLLPISQLCEVMHNNDNQYLREQTVQAITDNKHKLPGRQKQERYQDNNGGDWIDECERTLTFEEFIGAMKFTIGKYLRRLGKKDHDLQELEKIADYAERTLQVAKRHHGIDERA